jgi:hypothetical protein
MLLHKSARAPPQAKEVAPLLLLIVHAYAAVPQLAVSVTMVTRHTKASTQTHAECLQESANSHGVLLNQVVSCIALTILCNR